MKNVDNCWIVDNLFESLTSTAKATPSNRTKSANLDRFKDVLSSVLERRGRRNKEIDGDGGNDRPEPIVCIGSQNFEITKHRVADDVSASNIDVISFGTIVELLLLGDCLDKSLNDKKDDHQTPLWSKVKLNDRTSILSRDDETAVIQLCLAERNRKTNGVFDVHLDEIVPAKKRITWMRLKMLIKRCKDNERGQKVNLDKSEHDWPSESNLMNEMLASSACDDAVEHNRQGDDQLMIDYQAYLARCNVIDSLELLSWLLHNLHSKSSSNIFNISDLVVLQVPIDTIEKILLECLVIDRPTFKVSSAVISDHTMEMDCCSTNDVIKSLVKVEQCVLKGALLSAATDETSRVFCDEKPGTASELHVEKIILAYLRLLLNTRDEIALTMALGSMTNGFSHHAFTALRKLSTATGSLSMYQTALSFVLKVKLGGQSYAPDSDCPVMQYLPELSAFTTVMNKLQTVLEEEANSSNAFSRLFTVLRQHLTKTCNAKLNTEILGRAFENVGLLVQRVIKIMAQPPLLKTSADHHHNHHHHRTSRQKYISELHHLVNLHAMKLTLLSSSSKDCTFDAAFSSQNSPIRFPSLMSQFKSPLSDEITPTKPAKEISCELKGTTNSIDTIQTPSINLSKAQNSQVQSKPTVQLISDESNGSRSIAEINASNGGANDDRDKENIVSAATKSTSTFKRKPTKRCLINDDDDLSKCSPAQVVGTIDPPTSSNTKRARNAASVNTSKMSRPSRAAKKPPSKPLPKGQQLMTRFLRLS